MKVVQFPTRTNREESLRACLEVAVQRAFDSMTDVQLLKLVKDPLEIEVPLAKAA